MNLTTQDYALVISLFSVLLSIASFSWNVWSKFIFPKPKLRVSFGAREIVGLGENQRIELWAADVTDMGPAEVVVTGVSVSGRERFLGKRHYAMLAFVSDWTALLRPAHGDIAVERKVPVGGRLGFYFPRQDAKFLALRLDKLWVQDTFGRRHQVPRAQIKAAQREWKAAFPEQAGRSWTETASETEEA